MITQAELKRLLDYDPESGVFRWRVDVGRWGRIKAGSVAGCTNAAGYVVIGIGKKLHYAHVLAWCYMLGRFPEGQIDHRFGNRSDNAWKNLREVSPLEQARNWCIRKTNTSGVTGVQWRNDRQKWQTSIKVRGRAIYLGIFEEFGDAVAARKAAERKYGFHKNHGRAPVSQARNPKKTKSGVVGVSWGKAKRKWRAAIQVKGRRWELGEYSLLSDAVAARKEAERALRSG